MLRRILTIFGYVCLVLAIAGFTIALVAYGKDYAYDFKTGKIIQKGHVIIDSVPNGVAITKDGKSLGKETPHQGPFDVGQHVFSLARDGFWPWQKVLTVVAGRVTLANYVILVPKTPKQTTLDIKPEIIAQDVTRDRKRLAYISGGQGAGLYMLEIGNRKVTKLYEPKVATASEPAEALKDVEWSHDSSHLLITSEINGQPVHRLADTSGSEPVNLTQAYGFNLTGLKFSGSNWRQLYWTSPDGLRRLDVDSQTISGVLAGSVTQFWVQPDRVLYVQKTELGRSLWSMDGRGRKQELIAALPESDSYAVAFSRYDDEDELVVIPAKTQVATLYTGIYGDRPESKVLARDVADASFSPDGHLVALTAGPNVQVYDLERSKVDQTFVMYTLPKPSELTPVINWFDDHHFLINRESKLAFSEFDGFNSIPLGDAYRALPAFASNDRRSIITFRPDPSGVKIVQVQLR